MWRDADTNRDMDEFAIAQASPIWEMSVDPKIVLRGEGLEAFERAVETILSQEDTAAGFTKSEVEQLVRDALSGIMDSTGPTVLARATSAIGPLETMLSEQPASWTFWYPISNVTIPIGGFKMGKVTFHPPDYTGAMIETMQKVLQRRDETGERMIRDGFHSDSIAEVTVTSIGQRKAVALSTQSVVDSLSAIRLLYAPIYRDRHMFTDIKGEFTSISRSFSFASVRGVGSSYSWERLLQPVPFANRIVSQPAAKRLDELLSKEQEIWSEIEGRVVSALRIFGRALNQSLNSDSLVGMVTALEALLLRERDSKSEALSERGAHVLGGTASQKWKIYNRMKNIYDVRSDLVHGKPREVTETELQDLTLIAQACIDRALVIAPTLPNEGDMFRWFEEKKFQP
jgi:hypothetical protein